MSPTTSDTPMGVVVNIDAQIASEQRKALAIEITAATEAGDVDRVQELAHELASLLETQGDLVSAPIEETVELDADAIAVIQVAQAEGLEHMKCVKASDIQAALDRTNAQVVDALMNGAAVPDPLKSYRDTLNSLLPAISAAEDVDALDAIEIPEPPTS